MYKDLFDRLAEKISYRKRQVKRWIIFSGLNGTDRLSGNTDCFSKFLLI